MNKSGLKCRRLKKMKSFHTKRKRWICSVPQVDLLSSAEKESGGLVRFRTESRLWINYGTVAHDEQVDRQGRVLC